MQNLDQVVINIEQHYLRPTVLATLQSDLSNTGGLACFSSAVRQHYKMNDHITQLMRDSDRQVQQTLWLTTEQTE